MVVIQHPDFPRSGFVRFALQGRGKTMERQNQRRAVRGQQLLQMLVIGLVEAFQPSFFFDWAEGVAKDRQAITLDRDCCRIMRVTVQVDNQA